MLISFFNWHYTIKSNKYFNTSIDLIPVTHSPRPKKVRQVKSKVKSMIIIFSDIKGIVHKEFVLAGKNVDSAHYCDVL
jgi:hypothetical protein